MRTLPNNNIVAWVLSIWEMSFVSAGLTGFEVDVWRQQTLTEEKIMG